MSKSRDCDAIIILSFHRDKGSPKDFIRPLISPAPSETKNSFSKDDFILSFSVFKMIAVFPELKLPATTIIDFGGFNPRPRAGGDITDALKFPTDWGFNPRPRAGGDIVNFIRM